MAVNCWNGLKWPERTENNRKWLEMAGIAGKFWKLLQFTENSWKKLGIARNG